MTALCPATLLCDTVHDLPRCVCSTLCMAYDVAHADVCVHACMVVCVQEADAKTSDKEPAAKDEL